MTPIALRMLKKTDIEKRLTLPSKSLRYFPPLSGDKHKVDFAVRDECGHVWNFQIYTRKWNRKYLKPVLTRGWRQFVWTKQLCVDDRVAFYMDKDEADSIKYRVRVERAVKIFGVFVGHEPIQSTSSARQAIVSPISTQIC